MKRGAWKKNSITLTSDDAAINTLSTRAEPAPNAARIIGSAENIISENKQPHTNMSPPDRRWDSPRASRYDRANIASNPIESSKAKNQPSPTSKELSAKPAPTANNAAISARQRKLLTRPRAAANMEES
ncbi:MAG TPA: hypothetical protein PKY87_10565 [Terricaulis sp.]|nr:hypothetical protein [Terricaulis sp.]